MIRYPGTICNMMRDDTTRYDTKLRIRSDAIWYDAIWYDAIQCDMKRYECTIRSHDAIPGCDLLVV